MLARVRYLSNEFSKLSPTMHTGYWEHFEHKADIGVRGIGRSKAEAFEQAGIAMTAIITDPALVEPRDIVAISCEDDDPEFLFVEWLNQLIFEMATRKMLFSRFEVTITDGHLDASVRGEPADRKRHQPAVEVKGATLTELRVYQNTDRQWVAQCVVDV